MGNHPTGWPLLYEDTPRDVLSIRKSNVQCIFCPILQLGIALGFVVPASIVRSDKSEEAVELVGGDLYHMFLGVAVFTTALFLVILLGERASLCNVVLSRF